MNVRNLKTYIWLIETLYRAGRQGLLFGDIQRRYQQNEALSEGREYNLRTFHNHLNDIHEAFGIEIVCNLSNYRYAIADLGEVADATPFRRWLLEALSADYTLTLARNIRQNILLEDIPSGMKMLKPIVTAMQERYRIDFVYQSFTAEEPKRIPDFRPHCLKLFKQRWYMIGRGDDFRYKTYALDRMQEVVITKHKYVPDEDFDAALLFKDTYGVTLGKEPAEDILLKVTNQQANYLNTLPLHHSQQVVGHTRHYTKISLHVCPTDDLVRELLSMGAAVEVIKPESLRRRMAEVVKAMGRIYGVASY